MLWQNDLPSITALHYVSDDKELDCLKPWNISRQSFIRLLDYLQDEGYETLVFDDIIFNNS